MATKAQIDILVNTSESAKSLKEFKENIRQIDAALKEATDPTDINRLKTALGNARDGAGDFREELTIIGQNKFERLATIGGIAAAGFQAAISATALFGDESEELQKKLLMVQSAMAFTDSIGKLAEAPRQIKALGVAFGLLSTSTNAANVSTVTNTVVTGTNTVATNVNTTATIANQLAKLGLAGAAIAAVAALAYGAVKLYDFIKGEKDAKLATSDLNLELDAQTRKSKALFNSPLFKGNKEIAAAALERNTQLVKLERDYNDKIAEIRKDDEKSEKQKNAEINSATKAYLENKEAIELEYQNAVNEANKNQKEKDDRDAEDKKQKREKTIKDEQQKRQEAFQKELEDVDLRFAEKQASYLSEDELEKNSIQDRLNAANEKIEIAKKYNADIRQLTNERNKIIQEGYFNDKKQREQAAIDAAKEITTTREITGKVDDLLKDILEELDMDPYVSSFSGGLPNIAKIISENMPTIAAELQKTPSIMDVLFGIDKSDIGKLTLEQKNQKIAEMLSSSFGKLNETINGFYNLRLQSLERQKQDELDLFDSQTEKELQGVEKGSDAEGKILQRRNLERERLDQQLAKKTRAVQKEQAMFNNQITLLQTIANGAAAVMNAWKFDKTGILASFVAGVTALQVGLVMAQGAEIQKMKAAKGGMLYGNSHELGGIALTPTIEAEGGEFIVNKNSTRRFADTIQSINSGGDELLNELRALRYEMANPVRSYVVLNDVMEMMNKQEALRRQTEFS